MLPAVVLLSGCGLDITSEESTTAAQDTVRRGVIVLLGSVATHLDPADPRIPTITDSLIATLSTPSQKVQEAVSACLQPLVSATKERGPELLEHADRGEHHAHG